MRPRPAPVATAIATTLLLAGCGDRVRPDAVTEQGRTFADLWPLFVWLAVGVVALIWGLTIWSVVRYRRRPGADGLPRQKSENLPMEVLYTVTPIVVVAVLFGLSVAGHGTVTDTTDEPDVRVEVVGFQWQWQFRYPDHDVVVSGSPDRPALLVLPVDRTSQLDLVSADVNHSFWVPEFLSKRDLIIGVDNVIDLTPTETGSWIGRCAEYCGLDHWRMYFEVHVVPVEEFERWAEAAAQAEPTAVPRPDGVGTP